MESLKVAFVTYGFTIVFAMLIACTIPVLVWVMEKLRLDRAEDTVDISVPTSNTLKEEEAIAVAIAAARARQKRG